MAKELIISQTLNEYRAVLIDNGEIVDFLLERVQENDDRSPRVGIPTAPNRPRC